MYFIGHDIFKQKNKKETKQKILSTFRSSAGANTFTRIRGYVSTVRKQGKNALDCMKSTFTVNPFDPTLT